MRTHTTRRRRATSRWIALCGAAILFTAGCGRMEDTTQNFTNAIDKYYSAHPSCLWPDAVEFPVREDAAGPREISGYDALVHQALLVRKTDQTKAAGPGNAYDLSLQGRAAWVPDRQQAGFGNLCYGHRKVTSIGSSSPTTSQNGATTDVVSRYVIEGAPEWAKTAEVQTDFPRLQADLSGNQVGRATLTDTRKGWQVTSAPWAHISDSDIYK